jgi:hypothetical protein
MKPTQELVAERSAVLVALELLEKVVGAKPTAKRTKKADAAPAGRRAACKR